MVAIFCLKMLIVEYVKKHREEKFELYIIP